MNELVQCQPTPGAFQNQLETGKTPKAKRPKSDPERVTEVINQVNKLLNRARATIFEIGAVLIKAKQEMTRSDFQLVVKNSGLRSTSSADNYMRVAENEFLRKPGVMEHLPVGIGALIDVAAWREVEVEACIRDKTMHPHVERKTLRNWIDENRFHQEPAGPTYQSYVPVLIIEVDPDRWTVEDQGRLNSWLRKHLEEEFPDQLIQFSRPREGSDWPVEIRRRWEIHVKLRDQKALIDTLPTRDAINQSINIPTLLS